MAGRNSSRTFSRDEESIPNCATDGCGALESFDKSMTRKMLRVNASLIASTIMAGVLVVIGTYGQRYRHRPFTRFIFLGANTLFLPIISYVVSANADDSTDYTMASKSSESLYPSYLIADCDPNDHSALIVVWAFLVQILIVNAAVVVATDDREGPSIGPPYEVLVQAVWTLYLGTISTIPVLLLGHNLAIDILAYGLGPFALICAKITFKYYAFRTAKRSFALGRNPLLVFGYMQQLQQQEANLHGGDLQIGEDASPPRLLVAGENRSHVQKKPCGYVLKDSLLRPMSPSSSAIDNSTSLVTIDRVWQYEDNNMLPISRPPLKDLCLSFALFKLLRCRFARYKVQADAGSTSTGTLLNFFWSLLLRDGQHARVFAVIADELSFVNDYYYSGLPVSYSKHWLPILSIVISILSIGNCILIVANFYATYDIDNVFESQVDCEMKCIEGNYVCSLPSGKGYGNFMFFDVVPILLLAALLVLAEVRELASYICSNWTKVSLVGCIVNSFASSQQHFFNFKWVGLLLRCRCKLLKHWDGKMGQCSVLVIGSPRTALLLPCWRKAGKVKVPEAVKVCIIDTLRSSHSNNGRRLSNGRSSLRRSQGGESFVWACNGKGTCDTILVWHIATCIFEVKDPHHRRDQEHGSPPTSYAAGHRIAATHLSRYCVYLVARCPELLPDDDGWTKRLYKAVKKDAERALASCGCAGASAKPSMLEEYEKMVELLNEKSNNEVIENGVKLGKQLVETINDEETAWKLLAGFWSEVVLYVAPSDNLKGHKEAIARGGELITLLWALLFHAGIISRPGEEDGGAAATSAGAV